MVTGDAPATSSGGDELRFSSLRRFRARERGIRGRRGSSTHQLVPGGRGVSSRGAERLGNGGGARRVRVRVCGGVEAERRARGRR